MSAPEALPTPPPPATLLEAVFRLLSDSDYNVVHAKPDDYRDVEEVVVAAGDVAGRLVPLRMSLLNPVLDAPDAQAVGMAPLTVLIYHCSAVLPFQVPAENLSSVMQAAFLLNRLFPLCAFAVDARSGACYLAAAIPSQSATEVPGDVVLETVQAACYAIGTYGPRLHEIATGELSLDAFVASLQADGADLTPIPVPTLP